MKRGLSLWWMRRQSPLISFMTRISIIILLSIAPIISTADIIPNAADTTFSTETSPTEIIAMQILNRYQPHQTISKLDTITINAIEYYHATSIYTLDSNIGNLSELTK